MNIYFPLRFIANSNFDIDFMKIKIINFAISFALIIFSITMLYSKGLNLGIDFRGGTIIEATINEKVDLDSLSSQLNQLNLGEVITQKITDHEFSIKLGNDLDLQKNDLNISKIKEKLSTIYNDQLKFTKTDFVGPQVGKTLIQNGILALLFSFAGIMLYIGFRFQLKYGLGIIIALIHDTIFTLGFISLTGIEFNLTSIAAILTVIGYSVNDSVVIYDRIRENLQKNTKMKIASIINLSINETLSRTILTVLTTLIATLALILFGGENLQSFSKTVFFGIAIGTYSSIYVSAPILIYFGIDKKVR